MAKSVFDRDLELRAKSKRKIIKIDFIRTGEGRCSECGKEYVRQKIEGGVRVERISS